MKDGQKVRERLRARWRDAEVVEWAGFFLFFLSVQAEIRMLLKNYVSRARFIQPNQNKAADQT